MAGGDGNYSTEACALENNTFECTDQGLGLASSPLFHKYGSNPYQASTLENNEYPILFLVDKEYETCNLE